MSESNREHLSRLMDGDLDRGACRFLLRRLESDAEMRATWHRFHIVRACLHHEGFTAVDLAERVARAIEGEPIDVGGRRMPGWMRPLAGSAIAASVAVMAIVGINSTLLDRQAEPTENQPGFVSQSTSLDQPFTRSTPTVPVSYSEGNSAERQRISGHVLRHHQAAGRTGFVSFVPVVTSLRADNPPAPLKVEAQTEGESDPSRDPVAAEH